MPARKVAERDDAILSEDDLAAADTHPIERKNAKPRAPTKTGTKRKAPSKPARQVLADRTNVPSTDEGDDIEKPVSKRAKTIEAKRKPAAFEETTHLKEHVATISDTQQVVPKAKINAPRSEEIEESVLARNYNPAYTARAGSVKPTYGSDRARSGSVQPAYVPVRERSASIERERRTGDVEMRRQLTAMTRDCENLNLKNQALEDLVRTKAESNFDKLKREADLKTKQADELIASLKKELAALRKSRSTTTSETGTLQEQLTSVKESYEVCRQENAKLDEELTAAKQSLQAVENERKSLEAKLVAARQQLASDSSDTKTGNRNIGVKSTEAQKEAKLKESLYTDLTGLIIRGVKRKDGEDQYDCIQTGRNGTLHFHLSVMNETTGTNPKTPGLSYEEAEFSYEPFLDESRDKDLLEILPDYLSEDICFPRNHAVKFYTKVVESMTKKIVIEES